MQNSSVVTVLYLTPPGLFILQREVCIFDPFTWFAPLIPPPMPAPPTRVDCHSVLRTCDLFFFEIFFSLQNMRSPSGHFYTAVGVTLMAA